jgi:TonB-linked SusC/RagA family outer membrane protein
MKILLAVATVLFFLVASYGQNRVVSGKVTSSEDGEPLPGVNVVVQGTTKGTVTSMEGTYSIDLAQDETVLNFTFVGYTTQSIAVGDQTTINIALEPDTKTLDEVVVIGYGVVRKSDLTGAVSSVKGEDLTRIPAVSPMQALQGKVSGVQITSPSGAPGTSPVVRIRGTGTFNNANPIYVVDGMILDNIDYLNAADIQSMEVLKDASATAIYGSRGANGVIIVTTKRGAAGQETPVINFSGEYSIQKLQKKIDLLNGPEFATIVNEINPGTYNNVNAVPDTDWQGLLFQTAPIQNYQFSVAAASSKNEYYVGLGYFKQDGIIPKSNYERVTIKFNNTYHLADHVRLGGSLSFTPYRQENTNASAPFIVYRAQPVVAPYQSDGSYSPVAGVGNVLASLEYNNNSDRGIRSVNNVFAEIDFLKGFTFKSSFGVDMAYRKNKGFTPVFFVSPQQQNSLSTLTKKNSDQLTWLWENTLSFSKEIGVHRFNAVAGYTWQEASSEFLELQGQNIIREGEDFWYFTPDNINETGIANPNGVEADLNYSLASFLFRVNYVFNDKYLLTATYRRDGSSKFGTQNRYGDFPSVALGWNVIHESFMEAYPFITNLKLRASWGIIGNEKIDYNKRYSRVLNSLGSVFGSNETLHPGSTFGVSGNEDLKWESTYQTDVGLELGFFENQLTAELDYYSKTTKDILIALPVPGYLGNGTGATITYNAAEVLNRGFEYNVVWVSQTGDINYRIGTVGTTIHNRAMRVMGTGGSGDRLFNEAQTTASRPGLPLGAFYGYVADGVFQNQGEVDAYPHRSDAGIGDLRFVDTNDDGSITDADRTYLGSPIPTFVYGLNFELGYKGFDLSADFQGQTGNKIYNAKETIRPDLYNFEQHVYGRWTVEGSSNDEPRPTAGGYNWLPSSRFIQDGSFFRLRSVTLGYNLPQSLAENVKVRSARIYVRGTNLFTLTDFTGYSPEVASGNTANRTTGGNPIDAGIDIGTYPVSTIYSVGLNVTF